MMTNDTHEEQKTALFLTVGGSPEPLQTALRTIRPDYAVFVVSNGSDGSESSRNMVEDKVATYTQGGKEKQTTGLQYCEGCPDQYYCLEVPPDDPGKALSLIEPLMTELARKNHAVIADYTGGTKSMTAALVMAATGHEGARLQFMAGKRTDLVRVESGSEAATEIPQHLMSFAQVFTTVRGFVSSYDYAAARAAIETAQRMMGGSDGQAIKPPKSWMKRLANWKHWLTVLDLWDRFDHAGAFRAWQTAHENGAPWAELLVQARLDGRLKALAGVKGLPSVLLVEDLWLNALRRAHRGQFDDAIARLYRLAEASVQARLHERFGINTKTVPLADLPPEIREKQRPREDHKTGKPSETVPLGLKDARDYLACKDPKDKLARIWKENPPNWQGNRNNSILAHGFKPLGERDWVLAKAWFDDKKAVLWEDLLGRPTLPQLPDHLPKGF